MAQMRTNTQFHNNYHTDILIIIPSGMGKAHPIWIDLQSVIICVMYCNLDCHGKTIFLRHLFQKFSILFNLYLLRQTNDHPIWIDLLSVNFFASCVLYINYLEPLSWRSMTILQTLILENFNFVQHTFTQANNWCCCCHDNRQQSYQNICETFYIVNTVKKCKLTKSLKCG